ncbi:hypothetical protein IV203_007282 [Nitzschia inconspicua]|uniref:Uncharacterized protein n=1 Tax=Nitzschia inconspicua TaxID=303405 RepID=A0A9K3PCT4_9STRA|nr:hypothetical protein IV203_007282 [Nitzschia inconspicua]
MIFAHRLRVIGWLIVTVTIITALIDHKSVDGFCPTAVKGAGGVTTQVSSKTRITSFHLTQGVTTTSLFVKKKPVEQEKEKTNALGLFILYMTPWRNPNSIFVYMLLLLYALGKYSEAQSAARIAGI